MTTRKRIIRLARTALLAGLAATLLGAEPATRPAADRKIDLHQTGGETQGVVQVANLVYAESKSSKCFSDHFLAEAERVSSISTSRRSTLRRPAANRSCLRRVVLLRRSWH